MHRHYTPEEIQFVKKNIRGRSYVNMAKMFNERFGLRITLKQMECLIYKHGLRNGIGIFLPGHVPHNIGKTHKPWEGHYSPVGSERSDNGYIVVKSGHSTWKRKHAVIWEKANGKIPKGHIVIFADGNRRNFDPDNLLLVTKKEHFIMNALGLRSPNAALTRTGKIIADIRIAVAERKRSLKKRRKHERRN
jgi:hypothetical protein